MTHSKRRILTLATLMILGLFVFSVSAADFPAKPVSLIVPYSAGGTTDVCLRVLA